MHSAAIHGKMWGMKAWGGKWWTSTTWWRRFGWGEGTFGLGGHRPHWAWQTHELVAPRRAEPELPTWECGGCYQEVEEVVHLTASGRWCGERQPAVEIGDAWRLRHRAELGLR